ncbi:MAG: argininosuccinate lyase [Candidatus Freyarchaeota archaeon]|nr:argininosuccinate lyase [Candidatus Freyrarchaeum guaymaensis]
MSDKPWGGLFKEESIEEVENYTSSEDIKLDERLVLYDIIGTMAHDYMLWKVGVLDRRNAEKIFAALLKVKDAFERGELRLEVRFEDVHMNIEHKVVEIIGEEAGGMMHLARSRNDQVLVDIRMYLRDEINTLTNLLLNLIETLLKLAERNVKTVMPAFTHTRHAQPTTFAHWCLALSDMLLRCVTRLSEHYRRANLCPLGAGAVSGVSWPIDRKLVAELLGFEGVQENTLDVVSSRGELEAETVFILSLIMTILSRMSEDLIWWSTPEFAMIEIDEKYTTGSSIMPQKKNPDVLELVRGRASRVEGNLISLLSLLKALPLGYNRDQQETKPLLFHSIDITKETLSIVDHLMQTIKVNAERMKKLAGTGGTTATEIVDFLVAQGIPFRTAHRITGEYFKELPSEQHDAGLLSAIIEKWTKRKVSLSTSELDKILDPVQSLERRRHLGAPSPKEVERMIKERRERVRRERRLVKEREERIAYSLSRLEKLVRETK